MFRKRGKKHENRPRGYTKRSETDEHDRRVKSLRPQNGRVVVSLRETRLWDFAAYRLSETRIPSRIDPSTTKYATTLKFDEISP